MELLSKTTVATKAPGDGISAKDINSMNDTINAEVDYINTFLKSYCDVNILCGNLKKQFDLLTAIKSIMARTKRRSIGMKIKFLNSDGNYSEYYYTGETTEDSNFILESNWVKSNVTPVVVEDLPEEEEKDLVNIIDGGEW